MIHEHIPTVCLRYRLGPNEGLLYIATNPTLFKSQIKTWIFQDISRFHQFLTSLYYTVTPITLIHISNIVIRILH